MSCPDENEVVRFMRGELAPETAATLEQHIDRCKPCSELLAELGRLQSVDAGWPPRQTSFRDAPSRIGRSLGRYRLETPIGRGGMGEVYLASDPTLERPVAIKLLRSELRHEAAVRLVGEARAMARMSHPNVVQIYDAGEHEGEVFLAMEYVRGETLDAWLMRGPRDWRTVLECFLKAGEGLCAAHAMGILHRDFKPYNVLVSDDGRVLVTDFGLAVAMGAAGEPAGTFAYMAPEQLFGQAVDARADQFSFCVALHEALFGARPFPGRTSDDIRWHMLQAHPLRPERGDVPSEVVDALFRGLRIKAEERHTSMVELLADLRRSMTREGELHVRTHTIAQALFAVMHVLAASWFFYDTYLKDKPPAPSAPVSSSGGSEDASLLLGAVVIVWGLAVLTFLFAGGLWAVINAVGLARRRSWARISTIAYAVWGTSSCIGIPYAAYALWSLTRTSVKRVFLH
jgi:predicted Ser/Thr protein kinase